MDTVLALIVSDILDYTGVLMAEWAPLLALVLGVPLLFALVGFLRGLFGGGS